MQFRDAPLRAFSVALSALGIFLGTGCGSDDGIGKRYPVSGKVTYRGIPVEQGTITFLPDGAEEGARPAAGTIADGEYSLATVGDQDGALPGKYKVTVVSQELDESKLNIPTYGGQPTPESRRKAARTRKSLVPAKYAQPQSSELSYEVKPESNEANFELTD